MRRFLVLVTVIVVLLFAGAIASAPTSVVAGRSVNPHDVMAATAAMTMTAFAVEEPSSAYREHLEFTYQLPGWEGPDDRDRSHALPDAGVAVAEPIDLFNPRE